MKIPGKGRLKRKEKKLVSKRCSESLPVAHVKWEYIILSVSGFRSTNIRRMNSRAVIASF